MMSRKQVFKALIAVLILNVVIFALVTGCDDEDGGGRMNCCQFLETCEGNIGQQNCTDEGGEFVQNAQRFEDVELCIAVATPTPTPTPSATPTPAPTPTPTPTPTASPTPTPTPTVSPTPTPGPPDCDDVPGDISDEFFQQNAVTYTGQIIVNEEPVDVIKVLTSDGNVCTLVFNTVVVVDTPLGPAEINQITLMGPINGGGATCTFDETEANAVGVFLTEPPLPFDTTIEIATGNGTLSVDGQMLTLSNLGIVNIDPPPDVVELDDLTCNCESVEPVNQGARTEDAQRIHGEKVGELGIGTGN